MKRNEIDITDVLFPLDHVETTTEMRVKTLATLFGHKGIEDYMSLIAKYDERHSSAHEIARDSPNQFWHYVERKEKVLDKWFRLKMYSIQDPLHKLTEFQRTWHGFKPAPYDPKNWTAE